MGEWEGYPVAFGKRVRALRAANNLTLRQLEADTRISSTALSRVENGYEFPSSGMLHALSKCEYCDIDRLVIGHDLKDDGYVYFANTFEQESLSPKITKVTAIYMVRLSQIRLAADAEKYSSADKYDEYVFNLKLAEYICERYDNKAEEGQVFTAIRKILDKNMQEMSTVLNVDSNRYRYLEKHGGAKALELVRLYDKLKVNPAFVLSGNCERLVMHSGVAGN